MLFGFLNDIGNISERRVDVYEQGGLFVSTVRVSDGAQPYETAVEHPDYNGGRMVIVEAYDDTEAAQMGHDKWLATMLADEPPACLTDCANSVLCFGIQETFPRKHVTP